MNIREIINNKKNNKLLFSYDYYNNNKDKEINQYILTVNKKYKRHQYSLRIFKKGKIVKNNLNKNNKNFKLKDLKLNLKEFNTVSFGKNTSPLK